VPTIAKGRVVVMLIQLAKFMGDILYSRLYRVGFIPPVRDYDFGYWTAEERSSVRILIQYGRINHAIDTKADRPELNKKEIFISFSPI
jgi:hypothetical protein